MSRESPPDELETSELADAQAWVARLASRKMTVEEGASFRRWHAASPAHARAFAVVKQHWHLIGEAAQDLVPDGRHLTDRRIGRGGGVSRRWLLGAGAASAGIVLAVRPPVDLWSPLIDFTADYRTGIGEHRSIAMGEHVTVELSTRSRLSLQSDRPDELRMTLLVGEAAIASSARPIAVVAGNGETRAISGRFDLRNDAGTVRVTCLGGTVDVLCNDQRMTLRPNEQIRYAAQGLSSVTTADSDEITAWEHGVLIFRNQSLGYVVDEVNRYRAGRIILLNQALGSRPVALASFHLDRLDEIIPQIEALYGARARYLPAGIVLLS